MMRFMKEALGLAQKPFVAPHPNPRVGCVIVDALGNIVGRGFHEAAGKMHAEVMALEQARGCAESATVYCTLEPCVHQGRTGSCTEALIAAKVAKVVVAMQDPNPLVQGKGIAALQAAGIAVEVGLLEVEAAALNKGFISRQMRNRPFIRAKIAMSLDGRLALKNGASQWITCAVSREDVQCFRAQSDLLITGVGTVVADDPLLTVRDRGKPVVSQPVRVILDRTGRTPTTARMFAQPGVVWQTAASLPDFLKEAHAKGYQELWVEAGPRVLTSFYKQGCVDEWVIYLAPVFLGSAAKAPLHLELHALTEAVRFKLREAIPLGDGLRLVVGKDL